MKRFWVTTSSLRQPKFPRSDSAGKAADNATSIAEMLRQHRKVESCNDCHVRLDPWGIPFEEYNSIGRYQPLVP